MKGVTHIILTMETMLVIFTPLTNSLFTLKSIPAVLILLLLGTLIGSLALDIDKGKEADIYPAEIPGARDKKFHLTSVFKDRLDLFGGSFGILVINRMLLHLINILYQSKTSLQSIMIQRN